MTTPSCSGVKDEKPLWHKGGQIASFGSSTHRGLNTQFVNTLCGFCRTVKSMGSTEYEKATETHSTAKSDLSRIAEGHPDVVEDLRVLAPIETIAAFAGLLTRPELQANCYRLEAMIHLAVAFCRGRIQPTAAVARSIFNRLGDGHCGRVEDPAENVFATLVNTASGNFRIFEGLREGTGFYLQRLLNVLGSAPPVEPFTQLRASVRCLLKLSDEVASRAGITENQLGEELPSETLPAAIAERLPQLAHSVHFSTEDLAKLKISQDPLDPFIFDPGERSSLITQEIGNTMLERYPLVFYDDSWYLAAPTAVASAITLFIIDSLRSLGWEKSLEKALAAEFSRLVYDMPLLGKGQGPEIELQQVGNCWLGDQVVEIDVGRLLQVVLVVEGLDTFSDGGFNGIHRLCDQGLQALQTAMELAHRQAEKTANFRDGMTLVVAGGVERGFSFSLNSLLGSWGMVALPMHDYVTVSWLRDFSPLSLWRLDDAVKRLGALDIRFLNLSGFINLVAWARELNGHLVSHSELPDNFANENTPGVIWIPHNTHRRIRHSVLAEWDRPPPVSSISMGIGSRLGNWGALDLQKTIARIFMSVKWTCAEENCAVCILRHRAFGGSRSTLQPMPREI